jgi:NDP-sugar pyrophosphorylase family protein
MDKELEKLLQLLKKEGITNVVIEDGEIKNVEKVEVEKRKIENDSAFDVDKETLMSTAALVMSCDGDINKAVDRIWEVFEEAMHLGLKDALKNENDDITRTAIILNSYVVNTFKYTKALCAWKDNEIPKETAVKMFNRLAAQLKKELM